MRGIFIKSKTKKATLMRERTSRWKHKIY